MEAPLRPSDEGVKRLRRRLVDLRKTNDALRRELDERARAEDALRASELGARLVFDGIPALVVILSPSGSVERVNQRALAYFGKTLEEISSSATGDLVHPHDLGRATQAFGHSIASGKPFEVELRIRRVDGEHLWFLARALPLADADGRVENWHILLTDIDQRKRAEDELQARELSARLLVESMESIPALAIISNEVGEIVFANRQVLDYYGRTLEEVKKWPTSVYIVHPDDLEQANQLVAKALREGVACRDEYRLRRHDGVYRWFEGRYSPVRDAAGRITNWYVLLIDIDDRKRWEERLREGEAKLAAEKRLLEMMATGAEMPDVLAELCRQVEALAPGGYCSVLLVEPGERFRVGAGPSLPDSYNAFLDGVQIAPDGGPCGLAVTSRAVVVAANLADDNRWSLSGAMTAEGFASAWSTPILSGDSRQVLGTFAVYRREAGEPTPTEQELIDRFTPIAGIAIERAQGAAILRDRDAELGQAYSLLAEGQRLSRTGSFVWDLVADDHRWSDESYRIFELAPGSKVAMPVIQAAIHPEDMPAVEALIAGAVEADGFDFSFRILAPSGATKHLRSVAHRVGEIAERPVFIGAIQDVTEAVVSEQALNRARADLTRMARLTSLSALTASIAHEVSQPLAGIITNASTCLRMLGADPPNVDGALLTAQRTIRDGNRASEVIQRLRRLFARTPPTIESVDLNEAAREVLALSSSELQRRRTSVLTAFAEDLPPVQGDRVQLQQVILNLVLNAVDAMTDVKGRTRDLLVGSDREGEDQVRLWVRDAGVGLEAQGVERLFDPFYTTKPEGMGIGLSISRSIIEAHEGRLWAESNEDAPGATFAFSIPRARPPSPT